jgi:pheromone shutdown protein TraB
MRFLKNRLGMLVLSVWLILQGILSLLNVNFSGSGTVLAVLALVAGILLFLGR